MQTVKFSGLHCEACVKLITKKLQRIEGVNQVNPVGPNGTFTIQAAPQIEEAEIWQAIEGTDYTLESLE